MDTTSRNDPAATLAASFMWPLALARSWSSLLSFAPQSLTQPINPGWTLGNVINVTENNSNAPDTEREIVEQHSYGRQLGHITDALAVLVKSQLAEQPELSDDSRKCLDDFLTLAAKIDGIERPADALEAPPQCIPVLQADELPADLLGAPLGQVDARAGAAAAACIRQAAALAMAGEVAGIVTAPIHKEALAAAGVGFPGHTEMLQSLAGASAVRMMLANDELRVVLVTIHTSLRRAIDGVTFDAVLQTIRIAHQAAGRWG